MSEAWKTVETIHIDNKNSNENMRKYFKKYCGWYACFTLTALYSFVQMLILQIEFIPFFTQMIPVLHYIHHGVIFSFSGRVVIQTNDFHRAHSLKRTHK